MPLPGVNFVRKDTSIRLFGFQTWDSLLPWDPLARDLPDRIAPLLDQGFLDQWAGEPEDVVVLPEAEPDGSGEGGPRGRGRRHRSGGTRRPRATLAGARAAREELARAEGELARLEQRRLGLEQLARDAEDELAVSQGLFEKSAAAARAEEEELARLREELDEVRRGVRVADADARSARGRARAAGGSLRVVRASRRVRRMEERVRVQEEATEAARRRVEELRDALAAKETALERVLAQVKRAQEEELALRKRVTDVRRRAARASLAATSEGHPSGNGGAAAGPPERSRGAGSARTGPSVEELEHRLREASGAVAAAEAELRAAGDLVESVEAERRPKQQALLEAEAIAREAELRAHALEAQLLELERAARALAPAVEDAVAETRGAGTPLERAGPVLRLGARAIAARRIRRRSREVSAALGVARGEAREARERLEDARRAADQAREKLHQVRRLEMEARRRMVLAQRAYSDVLGRLTQLRLRDPAGPLEGGPALRFVILARDQRILGSLSFEEWAKRASGHGRVPRFILETPGEAIWLFRGEWLVADPELSLEDLTAVISASDDDSVGVQHGLDSDLVRFVWERDAGRCAQCGSVANLEVTHVVPVYLGGAEAAANLQLLCRNCIRDRSHQL